MMLGYLSPKETKAVLDFKLGLDRTLGSELVKIGLYGSKARGDFHHDSDIDLLIVVKARTCRIKQVIYDTLLDINALYDIYNISVHIYTETEYNSLADYPLSMPFWENYQRDEVRI